MQRLFAAFPGRSAGTALLLLRTTAGAVLAVQSTICLARGCAPTHPVVIAQALVIASGAALVAGFLTPISSAVAALRYLTIAFSWLPEATSGLFLGTPAALFGVVITASLVFLGPGAFSVDARLFGRREIIIPGD